MKAISLWQPWASLMAFGIKKIETRSWSTTYRGPLFIHAAKRPMDIIHSEAVRDFEDSGVDWRDLPYGCLVCQVDLIDVQLIAKPRAELVLEKTFTAREIVHGDFEPGRFAWITNNLKSFEPIPYRGRQRLFDVK